MSDIVPELYEKIYKEYEQQMKTHPGVVAFQRKFAKETATSEDASVYAADLGECAAAALDKYLTPKYLPDGKLYWNILERTVDPLMRDVFKRVTGAGAEVMRREDEAVGFHLNPVIPEYPAERVKALMESMLRRYETDDEAESL